MPEGFGDIAEVTDRRGFTVCDANDVPGGFMELLDAMPLN